MSTKSPLKVNVFSSRPDACAMCEQSPYGPAFESLKSAFLNMAETRLSPTQKTVLQCSVRTLEFRTLTLTALADQVSRKTGVAYSTVKWNLKSLVEMSLLTGGDADNRGEHARFSEVAVMLAKHLEINRIR
ncbi:MAG: hypothetical protein P1Q69_05770 [Candidatus Thorarchaeota archaeon]|nr:hypothetical protein [Candidatus Thorarchaeota archaeon]